MGEATKKRPLVWPCFVLVLLSSSMHVLGPPPISANSIGLLGLLLLGWGWKHRRGLARSSCWGLCALCATFWIQAPSPLSHGPSDPHRSTLSGTVVAVETKPRIPEWQRDPRRPPPSRWMPLRRRWMCRWLSLQAVMNGSLNLQLSNRCGHQKILCPEIETMLRLLWKSLFMVDDSDCLVMQTPNR